MVKALVTGGAGFVGKHLVELLLGKGHEVIVLDSLWTGSMTETNGHNMSFRFIKHDVRDPFPDSLRVDYIYHLACPASPARFTEDPLGIIRTCYEGTKNALDFARRCNARILLSSTSEVYGDPLVCPQPEEYWGNVNCFGPRSCYDEGKRIAEALAYAYRQHYGVTVRIARIFNAYGPGLRPDDGRVMSNFIMAAVRGQDIEVTGDGHSSRCFQYVEDCVRGLHSLMESDIDCPVNIGNDHETTIRELADAISMLVARKTGMPPAEIKYLPSLPDDPVRRVPDVTVARERLGWRPVVELNEGLLRSVEWYLNLQKS